MRRFVTGAVVWIVVWGICSVVFLSDPGVPFCSRPCPEVIPELEWAPIIVPAVVGAIATGTILRMAYR